MRAVVVSHPFGSPNAYQVAQAFQDSDLLARFHTCIYGGVGGKRREHAGLAASAVTCRPWFDVIRSALCLVPGARPIGRAIPLKDAIAREFDAWVARNLSPHVHTVWVYEDYGRATMIRARELGIDVVYDLPTVHYAFARAQAYREIARDRSLAPLYRSSHEPQSRIRRKQEELASASVIVCASSFVRDSAIRNGIDPRTIVVLPYGADLHTLTRTEVLRPTGPLRLLYAGAIAPHKGIHHLFEALSSIPRDEYTLTLAGYWAAGFKRWIKIRYKVKYHDCGMLPHCSMRTVYKEHDVLVFPALQDGFGLVITEAMANGLAVIASTHCAGPDLIDHGRTGLICPAGDSDSLRRSIELLAGKRELIAEIGAAARATIASRTWSNYRDRVVRFVVNRSRDIHTERLANLNQK